MKLKKAFAALAVTGGGLSLSLAGVTPASAATGTYGYTGNAAIAVSGGSDTTYQMMTALANVYNTSSIAGCATQTTAANPQSPALNQCSSVPAPTGPNANADRDTIANASPTGSSAGIASLNGDANISGTDTPGTYSYSGTASGSVDFARSSRAPKTSGGNCAGGNELTCDTFWGYAEDGVEVFGFGTHGGVALTGAQIYDIWSCQFNTWGQLLGASDPNGGASDSSPIVPWGMNSASGTYATFNTFLDKNGGSTSFTADSAQVSNSNGAYTPVPAQINSSGQTTAPGTCVRQLSGNSDPFENDVKPIFADAAAHGGLDQSNDYNDPDNWVWFGSYGLLSAFPYDSNYTFTPSGGTTAVTLAATPDKVNNISPSGSSIGGNTYPINRTLFHVTRKADADCPVDAGSTSCDFPGNPGPAITTAAGTSTNDLNVVSDGTGTASGPSKAVREFTQWLCRSSSSLEPVDPYTGINEFTEIGAARAGSGFTSVPSSLRTAGSSCFVDHS